MEVITNLKNFFLSAQEVALFIDKKIIKTTGKIHILLRHMEHLNQGIFNFSENFAESIHSF